MSDLRSVAAVLLAPVLMASALPAGAELCAFDQVPAATLLMPFFEVDLDDPGGLTTLFEVVNALPEAVLVRVTLWTDLAIPTYAFDVYLTGYDIQTFNLRDLFHGVPPLSGSELSPPGRFSDPAAPFPGCDDVIVPAVPVAHLAAAHRGLGSPMLGGQCAGLRHDDGHARGYVTVDVVGECGSGLFPSDPGYFGPDGVARYDNALWGDYYYVEPANNFAQNDALVRLEADPDAFGPDDRTFYGRYVGYNGSDGREPLPSAWALRSLAVGRDAEFEIVVWREVPAPALPFPCGEFPPPGSYPPVERILVFDEEENFFDPRWLPVSPPVFLVAPAASRQEHGWFAEPAGWWYADLDRSIIDPAQGYVTALFGAESRYSIAVGGTPMGPGCGPQGCDLGFEAPATRICVLGHGGGFDATLDPGQPALVRVIAGGCYCAGLEQAACAVRPAGPNTFDVDSRFCLVTPSIPCPPFCYEPSSDCLTGPLEPGVYTVRGAGREIVFTVPSTVPAGGLCAGEEAQ